MEQAVSAFKAMHPSLWTQYAYQYVALQQGIVIDHDVDEVTLVERIDKQYPETVVLIRQVLPQLPQTLLRYVRSSDSKIQIAARLSSGSLLLPHLGL